MNYQPLYVPPSPEPSKDSAFNPTLIKDVAPITHLTFSPIKSHFAIASSSKISIYSQHSTLIKNIARFKTIAYGPSFRSDGALLVAGEASGLVQIFDLKSRAILRSFTGHLGPVQVSRFDQDKIHLLTASDDKTVRYWDIPSQTAVNVFDQHQDYVRAAVLSPMHSLIFSGSYDHTVKAWDPRAQKCVMHWDFGMPVEALQLLPGSGLLAAAGGPKVKLFDILGGGKVSQILSNHSKTVTCLALNGAETHLLSGSLDHHLKAYNLIDYTVTYSSKYSAPILSVGMSKNDSTLAVGMANGLLSIKTKPVKESAEKAIARLRGGTRSHFLRGSSYKGQEEDVQILSQKRKRLAPYDKYLKSFQYSAALDAVLSNNSMNHAIIMSMIRELCHRDGLTIALGGRDERGLEPILTFIFKHIGNPAYTQTLANVSSVILDMYEPVASQSLVISEILFKLSQRLKDEIKVQKAMTRVLGLLDSLFALK